MDKYKIKTYVHPLKTDHCLNLQQIAVISDNDVKYHLRYQSASLHLSNKLRRNCLRRPHEDASPTPRFACILLWNRLRVQVPKHSGLLMLSITMSWMILSRSRWCCFKFCSRCFVNCAQNIGSRYNYVWVPSKNSKIHIQSHVSNSSDCTELATRYFRGLTYNSVFIIAQILGLA